MTAATRAVVIGGGSGIGAAVAAMHRAEGADVVVWDISDAGDIVCDISVPAEVDAAAVETLAGLGVPTIVTVSAGIGHSGMLLDVGDDAWDRVMGVNAKGVWLSLRS